MPDAESKAQVPHACALVIFGATGDLTHRKLVPALYGLMLDGMLPAGLAVVGYARRPMSDDQFRDDLRRAVAAHRGDTFDERVWQQFASGLFYVVGEFEDGADYARLKTRLEQIDAERGTQGRRLYYLATPPSAYTVVIGQLAAAGMVNAPREPARTRIIIEKPFGRDLASAEALNREVLQIFAESQVYRIDHYLGKETTQNILAFRFGNSVFEPLWNRRYVDHVEITMAESIGIEGRGGYYDQAGALRDMVQNHLMQLLALVAMEPPARFSAEALRSEKVKVLQAVMPLSVDDVAGSTVRAQYRAGRIDGKEVSDYCAEPGVAAGSQTETYVALKVCIDNWRWAGVPFYLRTGKALARRITEIVIQYRQPPLWLFRHAAHDGHGSDHVPESNVLRLRIQPDEGISRGVGLKAPGPEMVLQPVPLDWSYREAFGTAPREAYERLLHDALLGDRTLFLRNDEVEVAWSLMEPILASWSQGSPPVTRYDAGSWGPPEAVTFMTREGHAWTAL